jgi:hypothetical protein
MSSKRSAKTSNKSSSLAKKPTDIHTIINATGKNSKTNNSVKFIVRATHSTTKTTKPNLTIKDTCKNITKDKTDISNIIFKSIADGFSKGIYADIEVTIMDINGYVNATKMVQVINVMTGGKKPFRQWKMTNMGKELIDEVCLEINGTMQISKVGYSSCDISPIMADITDEDEDEDDDEDVYEQKKYEASKLFIQNNGGNIREINGTYVHPLLIPAIASWASPKFGLRVSKIVNEFFIKKESDRQKALLKEKDDTIDELNSNIQELLRNSRKQRLENKKQSDDLQEIKRHNKELLARTSDIYDINVDMDRKLDIVSKDRAVPTGKNRDINILVIIKPNTRRTKHVPNPLIIMLCVS